MAQIYFNGDKEVSKEEFDRERARIIAPDSADLQSVPRRLCGRYYGYNR